MDETHPVPSAAMSEEQFLDWAGTQEGRFELVEGLVVMHAGATRDHERVAKRVFAALLAQCDERVFDVNKGDFGVRIRPGRGKGSVFYPDVVVDLQSADGKERATTTPIVVVEVLSASTGYDDHLEKFEAYKVRDSLRQYVVLEQDVPRVYVWHKDVGHEDGIGWPAEPEILDGPDAVLAFPGVGARIALSDVYRIAEPGGGAAT